MAVLCLKAHPCGLFEVDNCEPAHHLRTCLPDSMDPYNEAQVVLFDTSCNRFTFITRSPVTGKLQCHSVTGSRRGRSICKQMGDLE